MPDWVCGLADGPRSRAVTFACDDGESATNTVTVRPPSRANQLPAFLVVFQALDGAIHRGLGNLQQVPHRQDLRSFGACQLLTAVERGGRRAVEQAGGVEQGVFEAEVFVDRVEALGGQVMVDGAVEGGAVFCGVDGWIG